MSGAAVPARPSWLQSRIAPLLLAAIVLALNLLTVSRWHSGDDLQFAGRVLQFASGVGVQPSSPGAALDRSTAASRPPQARYLLEFPTSRLLLAVGQRWNPARALSALQFGHALFAAVGVAFFFLAMRQIVPAAWSLVVSCGLASSAAWLWYATHLDYTMAAHAWSCVVLYALVSALGATSSRARRRWGAALGVANAMAALYLLPAVALVAVCVLTLRLAGDAALRRGAMAAYLRALLLVSILVGGSVWLWEGDAETAVPTIWQQITDRGASAHAFEPGDVLKSPYGFAKALATFPFLGNELPHDFLAGAAAWARIAFGIWYGALMLIAAAPLVAGVVLAKRLGTCRPLAAGLLLWFATQVVFGVYWEPSYIKWWTGALIAWWALLGMLLTHPVARPRLRLAVSVLVALLLAVNLLAMQLPNARAADPLWLEFAYAAHLHDVPRLIHSPSAQR